MPTRAWRDRVKFVTATTGTGTITVPGAAATGYQLFAATDNGLEFTFFIEDGLAWEVSKGIYTHAGTTLARVLISSSTGSLLVLSGSATVGVDWVTQDANSYGFCVQAYITGCLITKGTGNTINISAGVFFDPSTNKVITYGGASNLTVGTITTAVSQWNQVYMYDNAGTTTPEIVMNANPPATTYAATARQGGTNGNRRWIGCFQSNVASNGIISAATVEEISFNVVEQLWTQVLVVSSGTFLTYATPVSLATSVPRYACTEALMDWAISLVTLAGIARLQLSNNAVDDTFRFYAYTPVGELARIVSLVPVDPTVPQMYYKVSAGSGSGPQGTMSVLGWRIAR